jgi:hypothetical protein
MLVLRIAGCLEPHLCPAVCCPGMGHSFVGREVMYAAPDNPHRK